jgi:hypothetical protein
MLYGDAGVLCPVCFHEADTALTVDHDRTALTGRLLGWAGVSLWLSWVTGVLWVEALPWLLDQTWRQPHLELWSYDAGGSVLALGAMLVFAGISVVAAVGELVKALRDPLSSRSRRAIGLEYAVYLLLLGVPTASLAAQLVGLVLLTWVL